MDGDRYQRMRDIFHDACELEGAARRRFLDDVCAADATMRREIDDLFAREENSADQRLATPAVGPSLLAGLDPEAPTSAPRLPESIGGYRVLHRLGEGGMGVVYCAEQDYPRRTVAVKVLRGGVQSGQLLRRFRREADLLARLRHPCIAQMYEAGVGDVRTPNGPVASQPFFAMELVDGEPLTEYVRRRALNVPARLELMATICDAVQHAHERGVIHRDLKPANILVDASGTPRILDFGVACARDQEVQLTTAQTQVGQLIGTIAYMSPEQLSGDPTQIDTRTDIYSCATMLYELLAGELPHDTRTGTLPEIVRRIVETEPLPLRRRDPAFRGDIDAIAAKGLEKDRTRRYASAAALAEDLRRHLRQEPIFARPVTTTYLLGKFVRRHRTALIGVAVALFAVIGGLSYGLITSRLERDRALKAEATANDERRKATQQAHIAEAINAFLNEDVLSAVNPDNTPNPDIRMREVLEAASGKIDGRFPDEPLVEAGVRLALANTFIRLADYAAGERHLQRALELQRSHLPANDEALIRTLAKLAELVYHKGDYPRSEALFSEALEAARVTLGSEHEVTQATMGCLGFLQMRLGKYAEAEPMLIAAVECHRRKSPPTGELLPSLINLAQWNLYMQRFDQSEALFREAIDIGRSHFSGDHPDVLQAASNLAAQYNKTGDFAKAIPLLKETLEAQTRVLSASHPQTMLTATNLGFSYHKTGNLAEAERLFEEVFQQRQASLGESHPHTLISRLNLGGLRTTQKRFKEAEELLLKGEALARAAVGENSPDARRYYNSLAELYEQAGDRAAAAAWRQKLLTSQPAATGRG